MINSPPTAFQNYDGMSSALKAPVQTSFSVCPYICFYHSPVHYYNMQGSVMDEAQTPIVFSGKKEALTKPTFKDKPS